MNTMLQKLIVGFGLLACLGSGTLAGQTDSLPRETLLMDFGWRFHKGDLPVVHWGKLTKTGNYLNEPGIGLNFDDSHWRPLDLPHDYAVEGVLDRKNNSGHGYLPMEIGWYRRIFELPKEDLGRRIFVEFEGAYRDMTLYANQFPVGGYQSGYGTVRFDITDYLNYGGKNVLAVRTDATQPEGWYYEGGGLYRHVWLIKTSPVYIPYGGLQVQSWFKVDPVQGKPFLSDVPEGPAKIRVNTTVANMARISVNPKVRVSLLAPDGTQVAGGEARLAVKHLTEGNAVVETVVTAPRLWSLDEPQLYRAVAEVIVDGKVVDRLEQPFGIRTICFDANNGFFLNGKLIKIKGAGTHSDHACVGSAVPDQVAEFRIRRLKEYGFNAYRTSHHPDAPALLEACDRLGMLVMEEMRAVGSNERTLDDVRRLVLRDRNHPSIFLWSFANEEVALYDIPQGGFLTQRTSDLFHFLDPTRPTTMSRNGNYGKVEAEAVDVLGFNYHWDHWDKHHEMYPDKPMIETEMASTHTSRGVYTDRLQEGYLTEYDHPNYWIKTTFTRQEIKRQMARPWMSGGFVWTGFDYRGAPTPLYPDKWKLMKMPGEPPMVLSASQGDFDLCGFPKDEAFYYRAWFMDKPSMHLFPHWNWPGREGQPIEVVAYSNAEQVELVVNGKSLGRQTVAQYDYAKWEVPYAPGKIEAIGYKGGKEIVRDVRETTGQGVALVIASENGTTLGANREDVAIVRVSAIDAKGRHVPDAGNRVKFRVEGPVRLLGVGNGDQAKLLTGKLPECPLWAGWAQVIVQAMETPGTARLIAEADGLKSAVLELKLQDRQRRAYLSTSIKAEQTVMLWYDGNAPKVEKPGKTAKSTAVPQDDFSFVEFNAVGNSKMSEQEKAKDSSAAHKK